MQQSDAPTKFHVVCSDQSRNGKTLVARLLADYLILCKRAPLIFDAAPAVGGLRSFFPARVTKVELSTTAGQMALFDRALTQPRDCILDLPAHLLPGVSELMHHIGFGEEKHTPGLELVILFVADRTVDSLLAGRKLRILLQPARFIVVKNQAITFTDVDRLARSLYDGLAKRGQLVVPSLDEKSAAAVEDRTFSFRRFAEESSTGMPRQTYAAAVADFLGGVYRQFDLLGLGTDTKPPAAAARSKGLRLPSPRRR